jgi:hypothetical protein
MEAINHSVINIKGPKHKMMDIEDKLKDKIMSAKENVSYYSEKEETLKKDDSFTAYREKEAMTPAK